MYKTLCIPLIEYKQNKETILSIFQKLGLAKIEKINIISKKNLQGKITKRAFIHIEEWNENERAKKALERFEKGQDIKIIYDAPFYWKVLVANRE